MFSPLQQREVFHLVFLRQFVRRIKPGSYALKGGSNLRFFYNSIRYSEDMDLDVKGIEIFKLRDIVMDILASNTLLMAIRPFQIDRVIPPDLKSAKQTETVQRFKIHLMTPAGDDLFTKIEFSKRTLEPEVSPDSINETVLYPYKQSPLIVNHYLVTAAMRQKISALADRAKPQVRDVFDIYMLYPQIQKGWLETIKKGFPARKLKGAEEILFKMDFVQFRDAVCNYLSEEDRRYYDRPEIWEEIQLKVSGLLSTQEELA